MKTQMNAQTEIQHSIKVRLKQNDQSATARHRDPAALGGEKLPTGGGSDAASLFGSFDCCPPTGHPPFNYPGLAANPISWSDKP